MKMSIAKRKWGAILLAVLMIAALMPASVLTAHAASATDLAARINAYGTGGGTGTALSATADWNTVTVTGDVTDATTGNLTLDIDAGVTVVWQATLKSSNEDLLALSGGGAFVMESGEISVTLGVPIKASGDVAVRIQGGAVKSDSASAIDCSGAGNVVTVSDGEVAGGSNVDTFGTVNMRHTAPTVSGPNVIVSGTGKVNAGALGAGIITYGVVLVSGGVVNATYYGDGGNVIRARGAASSITVSGGEVRTASTGHSCIFISGANSSVTVSGGTVSGGTSAASRAIYASGANSVVTVSGTGIVQFTASINNSSAIYMTDTNSKVIVDGGEVKGGVSDGIYAAGGVEVKGGMVSGGSAAISSYGAGSSVTVSGGTVSSSSGNAIDAAGGPIDVQGGEVRTGNGRAIYLHSDASSLTVSGGTVIATGTNSTAISITRNVTVTVNGGTVKTTATGSGVSSVAIATSSGSGAADSLITVSGTGKVLTEGDNIANNAIDTYGSVCVEGGEVSAAYTNAILAEGATSVVTVSGGTVTGPGKQSSYILPVIEMSHNAPTASPNVIVSGTGKVEATANGGVAIRTSGGADIQGGEVSAGAGSAILAEGTASAVSVSGGTVRNTATSNANPVIDLTGSSAAAVTVNVTVSGTGQVVAAGSGGYGIRTYGSVLIDGGKVSAEAGTGYGVTTRAQYSTITVNGGEVSATAGRAVYPGYLNNTVIVNGGRVTATTGKGIYNYYDTGTVTINGGLVFAYGNAIPNDYLVYQPGGTYNAPSANGAVIVWNQAANNTSYTAGTAVDIVTDPAGATAYWAKSGDESGICYKNGTAEGFISLAVTVEGDTPDTIAPTLSAGNVNRTSHTSATIGFTTDEAGTAYYLARSHYDSAPTNVEVITADRSLGSVAVGATSGKSVTLAQGPRDIYVVVKDAAGNISDPLKIEAAAYVTPPTYNTSDIAVINAIIDNNGLNWTKASFDGSTVPAEWSGNNMSVTWSDDEAYKRVTELRLTGYSGNHLLGTLNVSGLTELQFLYCNENWLTALNVSGLAKLRTLNCEDNYLQKLDVSGLVGLNAFDCDDNRLTELNVSGATGLTHLRCSGNRLTALDLTGLTSLSSYNGANQSVPLNLKGGGNSYSANLTLNNPSGFANGLTYDSGTLTSNSTEIDTSPFMVQTGLDGRMLSGTFYLSYETLDTTAPTLAAAGANSVTHDSATLNFTSDEAGTYYYLVYAAPDNPPDADTLKAQGTAVAKGTGTAAASVNAASIGGLSDSAAYKAYVIVEDAAGNISDVTTIAFTTDAAPDATAPTLSAGSVIRTSDIAATIGFTTDEAGMAYYLVVDGGEAAPAKAEVKAATSLGSVAVGTVEDRAVTLTAGAKDIYVVVEDAAGNISDPLKIEAAAYAPPAGIYNANDIAVINAIIENNGLDWTKANPADGSYIPGDWTGATWSDKATDKRVMVLDIYDELLTGELDVSGLTALGTLFCHSNQLTALNVSGLTALQYLLCGGNELTELDISGLTALLSIDCGDNQLTALDMSGLADLEELYCDYNQLTELDLTGLAALRTLYCYSNQLTELDVSGLAALQKLYCYSNQLAALDIAGLSDLQMLYCFDNQLTELDVSGLTNLTYLYCFDNQLVELDLTGLSELSIYDGADQSVSLTLKGSGDSYLANVVLNSPSGLVNGLAYGSGTLTSTSAEIDASPFTVQTGLDDKTLSGTLHLSYETTTPPAGIYNADDIAVINAIIDNNGLGWTKANPADGSYVPGDWTGAAWSDETTNKRVTVLDIYDELLTGELNVSGLTALSNLYCNDNQLTALNVSGLTVLRTLDCEKNQLTALNVSGLTDLSGLYCGNNKLTELDVSGLTALTALHCGNNNLTELDVSGVSGLLELFCYDNQLTELDVSGLIGLLRLHCGNNQLSILDVSEITGLQELYCQLNKLTELDLREIDYLTYYLGAGQSASLTLKGSGDSYSANVALNSPSGLVSGLTYNSGTLTSTSAEIYTSPFTVQTGLEGKTLSGTLHLSYETLDATPPTGEIKLGTHSWNSFINTITFGLFCKDTQSVEIEAADDSGETATVEYFLADAQKTAAELQSATWTAYSGGFTIQPGSYVIYAKLTDPSGNSDIISSQGIVVYEDSEQDTVSISFTKGGTQDVTANVKLNGNTISKIMNDTTTLTSGTDYTVSGNTITFKASYLDSLVVDSYTLTLYYNPQDRGYVDEPSNDEPGTTTIGLTVLSANPTTYAVTVQSVGTGAAGSGSYAEGATVTINAGTPPTGMWFKGWTADPSVTFTDGTSAADSTAKFIMSASAVTMTANFEVIPATVTSVTVSPSTIEVEKDGTQQFGATVQGTNNPSQAVMWSVNGNDSTDTGISASGLLTVGADETASTLTVTATSAADSGKVGTATVILTDSTPTPIYGISLNASGTHIFPAVTAGYGAQTPLSVTITNTGNQATGNLTGALSGADTGAFELSAAYLGSIAVGGDAGFTVKPIMGLVAGTYTATVTVSGENGIAAGFDLSFTVNAVQVVDAQAPNISAQPQGATYTVGDTATALMVTATSPDGGTLSYQWYLNDMDSTTGGTAVGSGDASYTPSTATAGTAYYYVVVTNTNDAANGTKTATATSETAAVTVSAPIGTAPTITTESLPNGTVGITYSQTLIATGDTPISWSIDSGSLPDGLALSSEGVISGIPNVSGTFNFTIKATNDAGSDAETLSITVNNEDQTGDSDSTGGNNNAGANTGDTSGNTGGVGSKAGGNGGSSNNTTPNAESSTDSKSDAKDGAGTDASNNRTDNGSNSNEGKPGAISNSDTPHAQSDSGNTSDSNEKSRGFPWWILIVICVLAVGAIIVAVVKRRNRDEEDYAV